MRSKTSSWFECSVSYERTQDNGTQKRVTEKYVVEALSFTEAEANMTEEISYYVSGEMKVKGIVPAQYSEIFFSDAANDGYWFKVKVKFITIDEKTSKEKYTNVVYLVQGSDISSAKANIEKELNKSMADCNLSGINETKILDVFTL